MKRFYKSLTILLGVIVAIVGAISNLNYQSNDEVKAVGVNPQTSNDNYSTLTYSGNLFEGEVGVVTTDTTTTLLNFWNNELSSGFISYLNGGGWILQSIYVDDVVSANNTIVSSFSVGSHSIKFYYKDGPIGEYSPTGTFTVEEAAPVCSVSLVGSLSVTSYSLNENSSYSGESYLTNQIKSNLSSMTYTGANCSTTSVSSSSVSISYSPGVSYGNNSYTATISYLGVSFTKSVTLNWSYYVTPTLTAVLNQTSYSNNEPATSSVSNITDDLIYEIKGNLSNIIYSNSSGDSSSVSISNVSVSISPTITFGSNSYSATISYSGVSTTKTISFNWYSTISVGGSFANNVLTYNWDNTDTLLSVFQSSQDMILSPGKIANNLYSVSTKVDSVSVSSSSSLASFGPGIHSVEYTISYSNEYGSLYSGVITESFEVIDKPIIHGTSNYNTDDRTQISLATILSNLGVYDDESLTPGLQSDNYSENWQTQGTYTLIYYVVDTNGNSDTFTITINVTPWGAPITAATGLPEALIINASQGNGQPLTFVVFMDYLSSHYETPEGVSISITPETHPVFGANTYLVNGEYSLILSYIDDIAPTLIRPAGNIVSAGTSDTDVLNVIRNSLSVSDNSTNLSVSNITIKTDGYTEHKNAVGSYEVIFSVVDSFNNESTLTITINVVDTTAPNIIGPGTINATINSPLSISEILSNYTAIDNVEGDVTEDIVVEIDNYTANVSTLGNHSIILRVADSSNNVRRVEIKINVTASSATTPDTAVTGILGLIKKLIDWVLNLIKGFFGF